VHRAGTVTGDAKTQAEGAAEKAAGKVQNAVGGAAVSRYRGPRPAAPAQTAGPAEILTRLPAGTTVTKAVSRP